MTGAMHIVAVGARTPVGLTAESAAAAVRARISRLGDHPFMVDANGEPLKCAYDRHLIPTLPVVDRMVAMARHAIAEVAQKIMVHAGRSLDVPVLLALPAPRPGFQAAHAEHIAKEIASSEFPGITVAGVRWSHEGHASALRALAAAPSMLAGTTGVCVICGVDSYFDADTIDWLEEHRRLMREGIRDGFNPGEAAGAVAVADSDALVRWGVPSLARVRDVALALEERSPDSPIGLLGEGLSRAITAACASVRTPDEVVDDIYCDINGERFRTDDWGFVLLRAGGLFRDGTDYRFAADAWGDVGAASATLGCTLAVQAWRRGYAKGALTAVWGSSVAGLRGAVLLERGRG